LLDVAASIELVGSCIYVLTGTSKKIVGIAARSDLVGSSSIVIESDYSGILHCGEGRDVEQVARIFITIPVFVIALRLI